MPRPGASAPSGGGEVRSRVSTPTNAVRAFRASARAWNWRATMASSGSRPLRLASSCASGVGSVNPARIRTTPSLIPNSPNRARSEALASAPRPSGTPARRNLSAESNSFSRAARSMPARTASDSKSDCRMLRALCARSPATGTTPNASFRRLWSRRYRSAISPAESRESIRPAPISSALDSTARALTVPDRPASVSRNDSRNRRSEACICRIRYMIASASEGESPGVRKLTDRAETSSDRDAIPGVSIRVTARRLSEGHSTTSRSTSSARSVPRTNTSRPSTRFSGSVRGSPAIG